MQVYPMTKIPLRTVLDSETNMIKLIPVCFAIACMSFATGSVLPHDLTRPAARHTRTGMIGSETDFRIMLRGYPFETTENDIRQFLEGIT